MRVGDFQKEWQRGMKMKVGIFRRNNKGTNTNFVLPEQPNFTKILA
jgi:hypothetical protein